MGVLISEQYPMLDACYCGLTCHPPIIWTGTLLFIAKFKLGSVTYLFYKYLYNIQISSSQDKMKLYWSIRPMLTV